MRLLSCGAGTSRRKAPSYVCVAAWPVEPATVEGESPSMCELTGRAHTMCQLGAGLGAVHRNARTNSAGSRIADCGMAAVVRTFAAHRQQAASLERFPGRSGEVRFGGFGTQKPPVSRRPGSGGSAVDTVADWQCAHVIGPPTAIKPIPRADEGSTVRSPRSAGRGIKIMRIVDAGCLVPATKRAYPASAAFPKTGSRREGMVSRKDSPCVLRSPRPQLRP